MKRPYIYLLSSFEVDIIHCFMDIFEIGGEDDGEDRLLLNGSL